MSAFVLDFDEIDRTKLSLAGGKGANLGELSKMEGVHVPAGFCVTTAAYVEVTGDSGEFGTLLDALSPLTVADKDRIREFSARIRELIEGTAVPAAIADEIGRHLDTLGASGAYAVRSSATAEDLPTASFAGQQDTYLNIVGKDAVLRAVSRCWASLFTERAVTYRIRNGFDHRRVLLSVVVQRMVPSEAAGIMFTADPVTSNRKVTSIDAGFGLGEALVSGLATADHYTVRDGRIVAKQVTTQQLAINGVAGGGTARTPLDAERGRTQTLTDERILELERLGRKIEAHFGQPQDIEWALADGTLFIVQSRPITTLFPIPEEHDGKNHIYMSFGHQQMMTDAMKPLGLSYFQLVISDFPLVEAGGRLFIDLAHDLASPTGRGIANAAVKAIDPLIESGVKQLMKRKDFTKNLSRGTKAFAMGSGYFNWKMPGQFLQAYRSKEPTVIRALKAENAALIRDTKARIAGLSGDDLFAFVLDSQKDLAKASQDTRGITAIWVGVYAVSWINKRMEKWLGEKGTADVLSQAISDNVTSEMGLDLLDVADVVRRHPAVMDALPHLHDGRFFDELSALEGGGEVAAALRVYLDTYGMRCPGEIDITRPRWAEEPSQLSSMILSDIKNFAPGAHKTLYEQGLREAEEKEKSLLSRLSGRRAKKTRAMIARIRGFAGYREYPKYLMMQHYWIMKQALLEEAAKLVEEGVVRHTDDVYFLSFEEFREAARTKQLDYSIVEKRREEFAVFEKLTVPRVMTSEGEVLFGTYAGRTVPEGALAGIAASSGTVEGRARVVTNMEDADLAEGDILVTAYTDPSWTPLFLSASGLVTEVGGVATHGAVIAREYGLPAVVGVEGATKLIEDGQRIRVNGTEGYVEVLEAVEAATAAAPRVAPALGRC